MISAVNGQHSHVDETVWQHPSRPVRIYVTPGLAAQLAECALEGLKAEEPSEIGGLLFGSAAFNGRELYIFITAAQVITSEGKLFNTSSSPQDEEALRAAWEAGKAHLEYSPIGYFRSVIRDSFCLTKREEHVLEELLPEPGSLALLIRPLRTGFCTAGIFLWERNRLRGDFTDFEVPLFRSDSDAGNHVRRSDVEERIAAPQRREIVVSTVATPIPATNEQPPAENDETIAQRRQTPAATSRTLFWMTVCLCAVAVCLSAVLVTAAVFFYNSARRSERVAVTDSQITRSESQPRGDINPELALTVARPNPSQLDVIWDHRLAANAKSGYLDVTDGTKRVIVTLDEAQLQLGKLTYFPNGNDVSFRLDVILQNGSSLSKYIRVLGSAPATPAPAQQSAVASDQMKSLVLRKLQDVSSGAGLFPADMAPGQKSQQRTAAPRQILVRDPGKVVKGPRLFSIKSIPRLQAPIRLLPTAPTIADASAEIPPDGTPGLPDFIPSVPAPRVDTEPASAPPAEAAQPERQDLPSATTNPVSAVAHPLRQVMPHAPDVLVTDIRSPVHVRIGVRIDTRGRVVHTYPIAPGTLVPFCLAAAKYWTFTPAQLNGRAVESNYVIDFVFNPRVH